MASTLGSYLILQYNNSNNESKMSPEQALLNLRTFLQQIPNNIFFIKIKPILKNNCFKIFVGRNKVINAENLLKGHTEILQFRLAVEVGEV